MIAAVVMWIEQAKCWHVLSEKMLRCYAAGRSSYFGWALWASLPMKRVCL
jgi:hypothetical protein